MPTLFSFVLFSIFTLYALTFPLATFAQTQASPSAQVNYNLPSLPNYSPQSPQFMNLAFINVVHTLSCFAEGVSIIGAPCIGFVGKLDNARLSLVPQEVQTREHSSGVLGTLADAVALTISSPPLHTGDYINDLAKKLDLVPTVHAQVPGSGGGIIEPIKRLWELSRNLSYIGMTGVFLVVGFMIMFRSKLNPQTVVSIQSALPRLIIGLILITFSYLISALIIDLSFVSVGAVRGIFVAAGIADPTASGKILSGNAFSVFSGFIDPKGDELGKVVSETGQTLSFLKDGNTGNIVTGLSLFIGCKIGASLAGGAADILRLGTSSSATPGLASVLFGPISLLPFGNVAHVTSNLIGCGIGAPATLFAVKNTPIVEMVIGFIIYVVLLLALLITMFKIFFSVVNAYISVVLLTLTAPLRFLLGSVPGSKSAFGYWLKEMFANTLIFPAYYTVFFICAYILGGSTAVGFGIDPTKTSPINPTGGIPFLGNLSAAFLRVVLGYGLLLISPNIPDMIKGALGVKDPGYGKMAFGAALAGFGLGRNFGGRAFAPILKESKAIQEGIYKRKVMNYENPATQNKVAGWLEAVGWLRGGN